MGWTDSINRFTQSAVMKSKEMAEISRLNLEISRGEQRVRDVCLQLGQYLMRHPELLPTQDETVLEFQRSLAEAQDKLAQSQQTLMSVKNVAVCPGCGAQVSRTSRFCDRCGAPIDRPAQEELPAGTVCRQCGGALEAGALFCGNCGARQEPAPAQSPDEVQLPEDPS